MVGRHVAQIQQESGLLEIVTNHMMAVGAGVAGVAIGWGVAMVVLRSQTARALAHHKARNVFQYQREIQRLRQSNIDLENQVKSVSERLERREQVLRGSPSTEVSELREELRQARQELNQVRGGATSLAGGTSPVSTPLRPSAFQDFVAEPQGMPLPRRSA